MEKETTYRKIAETRYTFTEDEILEALLALYEIDLGYDHKFYIRDAHPSKLAQLFVKHTFPADASGLELT